MSATQNKSDTTTTLPTLERRRDALALRLERLNREQGNVVEGFEYSDAEIAGRVRGVLVDMVMVAINDINADICAQINPQARLSPSFTSRVMRAVAS